LHCAPINFGNAGGGAIDLRISPNGCGAMRGKPMRAQQLVLESGCRVHLVRNAFEGGMPA
jgi:hypothetical protein